MPKVANCIKCGKAIFVLVGKTLEEHPQRHKKDCSFLNLKGDSPSSETPSGSSHS